MYCDAGLHEWCVMLTPDRYVCTRCGLGLRILRPKQEFSIPPMCYTPMSNGQFVCYSTEWIQTGNVRIDRILPVWHQPELVVQAP